jgi:hypothetical protein
MLKSFIVLFAVASVLPLAAGGVEQIQQAHVRIQHTNDRWWQTNKYVFGTLGTLTGKSGPEYIAFDMENGNNWHPDFNGIPIREQFRLVQEDVHWGKETNYVKAGLLLQYSPNTNRTDVASYFLLNNGYTNNPPDEAHGFYPNGVHGVRVILWLPPLDQRYQVVLRDDKGNLVPKTKWGEKFGKPVVLKFNRFKDSGYQRCSLDTNPSITVIPSPILLRDCFKITAAGKYHLEFEMRVLKETGTSPPYEEYHFFVNSEVSITNPL